MAAVPPEVLVAGAPMTPMNVGPLSAMPVFNMRNGDLARAEKLWVHHAIPAGFHWIPVDHMLAQHAMHHVESYIRSAYAQLEANPPAGYTNAQRRKAAIILGVSRAVATEHYAIDDNDLVPWGKRDAIYSYVPATASHPYGSLVATGDAGKVTGASP